MSGISTRWGWFLVIAMEGVFSFFGNCANAQITPDSTLPNNSNVTPDGSTFNVAVPYENSYIAANAFSGTGGNISITTQGIFGFRFRNLPSLESSYITASGDLKLVIRNIDPSRGLVELPVNLVDISQQIDTGCNPGSKQRRSSFVITGRGGLPPNPSDMLTPDAVLVDLITLNPNIDNRKSPSVTIKPTTDAPERIVEATGWVINEKGEVILTADASTTAPHGSWQNPASCRAS